MKSPRDCALESERHPRLPSGTEERVSGYGVMGQPFASGHVLGLRRWTASSVGDFWIPQHGIFAMGRVFIDT